MSKKPVLSPAEQARADREVRRLAKAAKLPPNPTEGGAFIVGPGGELLREVEPAPADPAVKEA